MLMRTSNQAQLLDAPPSPMGAPAAFDPRGLWLILRWRARLILITTVGTILVALAAISALPPSYKATAVLLIQAQQPRVTQAETVVAGIGADAAAVESQVELIESTAVARRVIEQQHLDLDPEFASAGLLQRLTSAAGSLFGPTVGGADLRDNQLLYRFRKGLDVRRRGLTYVLEVSYSASSAQKAARLANAVAQAYLDDQRAARAEITQRASGWLGERAEELRDKMRESDRAVADYKTRNNIVGVTQGNRLIDKQLEDLNQQLTLARSRRADAEARLARIEGAHLNADSASLAETLQSAAIAGLRTQYAEVARVEAEYNALYGPRHPSLVGIRAQRADLRGQIEAEIARVVDGVRNEARIAQTREKTLESDLTRLKQQSSQTTETDVKLHELERDAQANRTLFEQFLSRSKETTEQESLQIADARIVTPASPPLQPSRPSMLVLLAVAAVIGLMAGTALALLLEHLRRGFRRASEIEQQLLMPALGTLPLTGESAAASRLPARVMRLPAGELANPYLSALRNIRARLRRMRNGAHGEVLVVISALPDEGKSTFASDLALASATSGVRTLLIDADFQARSISENFGIVGAGLLDVVNCQAKASDVVCQDSRSGLHLVGAGGGTAAAASEFNELRLDDVLTEYRERYDVIVVDTPALLADSAGAAFVGCSDRTVLLVEWERTAREAVWEALSLLGQDVDKVAGAILNKVPAAWYQQFESSHYGYANTLGVASQPARSQAVATVPQNVAD